MSVTSPKYIINEEAWDLAFFRMRDYNLLRKSNSCINQQSGCYICPSVLEALRATVGILVFIVFKFSSLSET